MFSSYRIKLVVLSALALNFAGNLQAASVPAVEARNGMVVTSQHLASQVGVDILEWAATPSTRRSLSATRRPWSIPVAATSAAAVS